MASAGCPATPARRRSRRRSTRPSCAATSTPDPDPAPPRRPGPGELEAARDRVVDDVVANDLRLLVVGINPGLWTAWSGHHFARPGNRFWKALHAAGITPRVLDPAEERTLLDLGLGITNMVPRTTAAATELTPDEVRAGGARLEALVARRRPRAVAVLGMGAYRTAFGRPRAGLGRQPQTIAGAPVWVVPNPSGLQARYGVDEIGELLREAWEAGSGGGRAK